MLSRRNRKKSKSFIPPKTKKIVKKPQERRAEPVYMDESIFRPQTKHHRTYWHFLFSGGGLGDYINHMSAMLWIAEKNKQCIGRVAAAPPFLEVAKYVMKDYPEWQVYELSLIHI